MVHTPRRMLQLGIAVALDALAVLLLVFAAGDVRLIGLAVVALVVGFGFVFQAAIVLKTLEVQDDGLRVGARVVPWTEVRVGAVDQKASPAGTLRVFVLHYGADSLTVTENLYGTFRVLHQQLVERTS